METDLSRAIKASLGNITEAHLKIKNKVSLPLKKKKRNLQALSPIIEFKIK